MAKVSRLVPPRAAQILGECHRLLSERLPALQTLLLDRADDTFFELANKADSSQRQQLYFDAMRELRLKRGDLEKTLQASLKADFDACFTAAPGKPRAFDAGDGGFELALVGADDVEESLAVTNFVESVRTRCKQDIFALDQRVGHLLSDPKLVSNANPFGPETLGKGLRAMCRLLEAHIEARITLLKLSDRCIGTALHELYRSLNELLVREDVLPRLASQYGRHGDAPRTRVVIETEEGTTEVVGRDVFSTLQQLMHGEGAPGRSVAGLAARSGAGAGSGAVGPGGGAGLTSSGFPALFGSDAAAGSSGHGAAAGAGIGGALAGTSGGGSVNATGGAGTGDNAAVGANGATVADQPAQAGGVGGGTMPTATFVTGLTQLQQGHPGGVFASLDPGSIAAGPVNVLRTLKESGAIGELNQTDTLTLDIVTLLFDYILDDPSIPDRIKALIGRLQIPLLKVALLDKELFSRRTHPARQLLDALAAAAVGWSEGTAHGDALLEKIEYIVYRVVEEFDRDLGLFTQLLAELNTFLADDERLAHAQAERAANSLRTKERIVLAKMAVDDAVKSRLAVDDVREFVCQFVRDYWRQMLIVTYIEQGPASEAWQSQLEVIDDLVWSVQPKLTPEDKRELTTRLPRLLKAVKAGMKELAMEPAVCSRFLTMLASVHVVSVKNVEEATLAERRLTQRESTEVLSTATPAAEEAFVKQALDRLFARKTVDAAELDIDFSALEADVAQPVEEEPPVADDEYLEKVMALDLGDWLEFTLEDGSAIRSRFTWISPATGRYLFTDRQGRKAFDLTLNALVERFREDRVLRIAANPDPLFERAIGELMDRLERQVA